MEYGALTDDEHNVLMILRAMPFATADYQGSIHPTEFLAMGRRLVMRGLATSINVGTPDEAFRITARGLEASRTRAPWECAA